LNFFNLIKSNELIKKNIIKILNQSHIFHIEKVEHVSPREVMID